MTDLSDHARARLYVVRHGSTAFNVDERYLGALDPPLNEQGRRQALALAQRLHGVADVVVSSPRLRAVQTAEVLACAWKLPLHVVEHFAERDVGVFEGLTKEEARHAYPALWARDITRRWDEAPPGGESIEAVFARVALGLQALQLAFTGKAVALVAHGFVAKVVRALMEDVAWDGFFAYSLHNGEADAYSFSQRIDYAIRGQHWGKNIG